MSSVFFISDLHLGHKNVLNFSPCRKYWAGSDDIDVHDEWLADTWNDTITKRDKVFILGDVAWNANALRKMKTWNGTKVVVKGNHDNRIQMSEWYNIFNDVWGLGRYKNLWLSHCPVREDEIRGDYNVHGHLHSETFQDGKYLCVCVEALKGVPISYDEMMERVS